MDEKKEKEKSAIINDEKLDNVSGGMASRYDIMDKQRPNKMSDRKIPKAWEIEVDHF